MGGECSVTRKQKIEHWRAKGFTEETIFDREYVLLFHPKNLDCVRVYDNGDVWLKDNSSGATGCYLKVEE